MANLRANRITSTEVFETTGSVQFDGDGDYLSLASSSDFAFGTGDFTIELWVMMQSLPTTSKMLLDFRSSGTAEARPTIYYRGSNSFTYYADGAVRSEFPSISANRWYYITICRHNSITRTFLDGIEVGSFSDNIDYLSAPLGIGAYLPDTSQYIPEAHISNVRILKGTALYTTNFTPPTRELEVIPNTVLLACQSTTKADEEKTGKTITVNGDAVANELTPGLLTNVVKSGGSSAITGSVEFDGTSDYLAVTNSNDFDFDAAITIEAYVYFSDLTGSPVVFARGGGATGSSWNTTDGAQFAIYGTSTGRISFEYNSSGTPIQIISATGTLSANSWNHIAVTYDGTTFTLYLNGINVGTASNTPTMPTTRSNIWIGMWPTTAFVQDMKGFISNLRVIKGTALYTQNFIPPTRNLTKLPGTVLLCCQDSNDPTTEATGKTITGFGRYFAATGELFANTGFTTDSDWTKGSGWTISNGLATHAQGTAGDLYQSVSGLVTGQIYKLSVDIISTDNDVAYFYIDGYPGSNYPPLTSSDTSPVGNHFIYFAAPASTVNIGFRGSSLFAGSITNLRLSSAEHDKGASNFTPQVGSDGSVEFAGPTTINTENYFYLPTGPTEQRSRGRGLFGGGDPGINTINYITIASMGNAQDFGDLSQTRLGPGSVASSTRAVFMTGYSGGNVDTMDFVTIATTGNAVDFGNLADDDRHESAGVSNQTRGMVGGGQGSAISDRIDYITIASTGDSIDFGNLTLARRNATGVMSPTRGVFCGGRDNTPAPSTQQEEMDYVTIASTGNAINFGDLTVARGRMGSVCSSVRGVVGGGEGSPADSNVIDYITIASTGNAQDFGDMITASEGASGGCSNSMRGVFGGHDVPGGVNTMEYVTISSTGNSQDFGDLLNTAQRRSGCSDSHGGLG